MYILTNIDDLKRTYESDAAFIEIIREIAVENGDMETIITTIDEAISYVEVYCPDLSVEKVN